MIQFFFLKCDERDSPFLRKFLKPRFLFFNRNAYQLLYCLSVYIRVRQADRSFLFNHFCFFIFAASHSQCHHPGNDLYRRYKWFTGRMYCYGNSNFRSGFCIRKTVYQTFRQFSSPWKFTVESDRFSCQQRC